MTATYLYIFTLLLAIGPSWFNTEAVQKEITSTDLPWLNTDAVQEGIHTTGLPWFQQGIPAIGFPWFNAEGVQQGISSIDFPWFNTEVVQQAIPAIGFPGFNTEEVDQGISSTVLPVFNSEIVAQGTVLSANTHNTESRSLGLTGRLAVVTGGASGIGKSVCMVLAREGATVVVADRNRTGSEETIQLLQATYGGDHRAIQVDVSDSASVSLLFKKLKSSFPDKKTTCVVNSAGIVERPTPIATMSDTVFDNTISTNLRGTFLINRAAVQSMLADNVADGSIVNLASIIAPRGFPGLGAYAASKGGVVSFTRTLAQELATKGIRVNAVLPGPTDTPMLAGLPQEVMKIFVEVTPMKRKARPVEQAETVAFLCSPKSSFTTGAAVEVTGGITG